ncbi:MAG TPA: H-type lectin domain-containing protein [Kofleriaceae bacterium]
MVDAAIFRIDGRAASLEIQDLGAWSGTLGAVALGLEVIKRGRTTRLTRGTVKYTDAMLQISYGNGRAITYTGLIGVGPRSPSRQFSAPGDSGAVVLDVAGRRIVSLHFAGNGVDGWGCPIGAVEQALDFRVMPDATDTGRFSTTDVRPPDMPRLDHEKPVVFAQPYAAPPQIAVGLTELDAGLTTDLRISASARDVTATGFTAALDARGDTVLYRAASTWLEVAPGDPDLQIGTFSTREVAREPRLTTARRIDFARGYAAAPAVRVWLRELDLGHRANARVRAHVTDIDPAGFTVHIESWADTALRAAGVTWIAHPADHPDIASGTFHTLDVRPWNQPRAVTRGTVRFPPGRFTAPPRVVVALHALDVDRQANLRVTSSVSAVSATGMSWSLDSWADSRLYSAGASYVALGCREPRGPAARCT